MSKREELIAHVASLTSEQVDKIMKRFSLLEQMTEMSENELLFTERFLGKVCGKATA
ncbi:MAG: hypothetical protein IJ381_07170 [Clostridia bacterium]|nr:hypothetical protein [Clostridia bacterium]